MNQREVFSVPRFAGNGWEERPVRLLLGGCYTEMYDHSIAKRIIDEYVLILCTDGQGWVEIGDHKRKPVKSGQILFLSPGVAHRYGSTPGQYWSLLWFHCLGSGMPFFFQQIHQAAKQDTVSPLTTIGTERFYFERALSVLKDTSSLIDVVAAESIVTELFCEMANTVQKHSFSLANKHVIESAVETLETTDNYNLSLDELANTFGLSKYYFIRLFKQHSGYTPMEYFQRVKLKKSCTLLTDPSLSIGEISESLGYSNQYYFSKAFKSLFGLSPSDFRKLL